jgi:hypothetical protein
VARLQRNGGSTTTEQRGGTIQTEVVPFAASVYQSRISGRPPIGDTTVAAYVSKRPRMLRLTSALGLLVMI